MSGVPGSESSPLGRRERTRFRTENANYTRALRACNICRRLKEKCEGGIPCKRCSRLHHRCEFRQISIPADTAGSQNERNLTSDEKTRYLERIARHFLGNITFDVSNLRNISEKIQQNENDQWPPMIEESGRNKEGGPEINEDNFTVKTLSDNTAHYSGELSHWSFSQRVRRRVHQHLESAHTAEELHDKMRIKEYFRATQLQSPSSLISASVACLPPRAIADFLTDTFFKYAGTNYFLVRESWLEDKLRICYDQPAILSASDATWVCSVLMVLAIGTQFAHMNQNKFKARDLREPTPDSDDEPNENNVGVSLYRVACKLLPDVITIASTESVQACLLLGKYTLPLDAQGLAYTYLGLAIKVAIQNGMHRKYTGTEFDSQTLEERNRLWWTAYTMERRISVLHGRPESISHVEVDAMLPIDVPEFRCGRQRSSFANMIALVHLTSRLGEISSTIGLLRKCPKRLRATYFRRLMQIRGSFLQWWETLPTDIECRDLDPDTPMLRQNIHLNLCFHLNRIFMGRPFMFYEQVTEGTESTKSSDLLVLVTDCVEGALETIRLLEVLHNVVGLARASYTEFSSCRAALLVICCQCLNEWTETLGTTLSRGLKLMKLMAVSIDSAKSELSVIQALEIAIRDLEARGKSKSQKERTPTSQYDTFKSWARCWDPRSMDVDLSVDQARIRPLNEEITNQYQQNGNEPLPSVSNISEFGLENLLSSFPEEAGEFAALPLIDDDFQYSLDGSEDRGHTLNHGSIDYEFSSR